MVTQIGNSMSFAPVSRANARPPEQQQAFKELGLALRNSDMDAAKQTYATIVRNAPEGAKWNPDSPFAQMGRAFVAGDLTAAKSAYAAMITSHLPRNGIMPPPPTPLEPAAGSPDNATPGQVSLMA